MSNLATAISIAALGFKEKTDKAGKPYILHCIRVMLGTNSDDDEVKCIAMLHDCPEDEVCTVAELREYGFSERVCTGVDILTHKPPTTYENYIKLISNYPDCVKVKLADLKDNSDITRLKGLTKKDHDRIQKYHTWYTYLSKI